MAEIIDEIILKVKTDASEARNGVKKVGEEVEQVNSKSKQLTNTFKGLLSALGVATVVSGLIKIGKASLAAAAKAEGIEQAFRRIGDDNLLEKLRKQTKNLISDTDLQKFAVRFEQFNLPVKDLGNLLAFATQRAQDTGESVDYLTESLVTGLARKSLPILDNLGLNTKEIGEEAEKAGDFFKGVGTIVAREMGKAENSTETYSQIMQRMQVVMSNLQNELGEALLPTFKTLGNYLNIGAQYLFKFFQQLRGVEKATGTTAIVIERILAPFRLLRDVVRNLFEVWQNIYDVFGRVAERLGFTGERFNIFSKIIELTTKKFEVMGDIMYYAAAITNGLVSSVEAVVDSFLNLKDLFTDFDINRPLESFKKLGEGFKKSGSDVAGAFNEGFKAIMNNKRERREVEESATNSGTVIGNTLGTAIVEETEKVVNEKLKKFLELSKNEFANELSNIEPPKLDSEVLRDLDIDGGFLIDDINQWFEDNPDRAKVKVPVELNLSDKADIADEFVELASGISSFIDSLGIGERIQREIDALDELIDKQRDTISETEENASQGNAKQLALEENRLEQLQAARDAAEEKKAKAEKASLIISKAVALAEIGINLAREISTINATYAATPPIAAAFTAKAIALAALQTASVIATAIPSFYEGTEDTGNGGKVDSRGGFNAILHPNERVMTAKQNNELKKVFGYTPKNDELVEILKNSKKLGVGSNGMLINMSEANNSMVLNSKVSELIDINKRMLRALSNNGTNINVDENGFAIRMNKVAERQQILNKL